MAAVISLGRTMVAAGVVHAAVALFVAEYKPRPVLRDAGEPQKLVWVESMEEVLPAEPVQPEPIGHEAPSDEAIAVDRSRVDRRPVTAAASSAVALPESEAAPGGWTLNVTSGQPRASSPGALQQLGLDGKNRFLGARPTGPEADPDKEARAEGNRQAGEAMRAALHDHDVALGLGGGGPVVKELEAALLASTAPLESHAVLVAVADASGAVIKVDVESSSEDPAAFRALADEVLARLKGQSVRVPAGHGLSMRIDVVSRVVMPSGGGGGMTFDPKHAGAGFDLSDIGTKPHRVIHARVLAEDVL